EANAHAGTDAINFNIAGAGVHTISLASALPGITDPVTIDGYTQPGASANTLAVGDDANLLIEIDGTNLANVLNFIGGGSTVRGLVINRYTSTNTAILFQTNGNDVVEGCFIGTDTTGTIDLNTGSDGVFISTSNNRIGGTNPAQRNIISGNDTFGIEITGAGATGNQVKGNYIGTDATGTADLGNGSNGVHIFAAPNNIVGGASVAERNVISGNDGSGVFIGNAGATGNIVRGNFIGTDATGASALGNTGNGVVINAASANEIGGTTTGAGNRIAFNGVGGVVVEASATNNAVLGNATFQNGGLGIDLGSDGVTANDANDADTGPNNLQNFPVLTSATKFGGSVRVQGNLNSAASTVFRLEFFSNPACDAPGNGEGQAFLGSASVTTDAGGNASFNVTLPSAVAAGEVVTATATDPSGNTSEFSACLPVTLSSSCGSVSFAAATNTGTGSQPVSVVVGDFNLDGKPDIAVSNALSDNESIFLGDGAGNFSAATNFATGTTPHRAAVSDFNLDGKQDLAVADAGSNNVSVLLGDGAGGFSAATNFNVGTAPISVAVADFNGDGQPDIVAANRDSNSVSVLLGDSAGNFLAATSFNVGSSPQSVAVGDFNGDGQPDIVAANFSSANVSVLLGNGAGGFSAATNFNVGSNPLSVVVSDFNADGKQDLAVANQVSNNVSVLLGDGAGGFSAATNFNAGNAPFDVKVGDFDGDGNQDLAVANQGANSVSVLLGDGAGSFGAATNFGVGSNPRTIAVGDFNGDGKPDLISANQFSDNISVLLGNCASASGSTFTVNSTGDGADNNPGDDTCNDGTGNCTLRAAIMEANAHAGTDAINFNIAGAGVHTISLASALPGITDPVTIDGYTQPGASRNTLDTGDNAVVEIELDGTSAGATASGLSITGGSSTVRGLVINRFGSGAGPGGIGIELNSSGNVVEGCFIGTNASGTAAAANNFDAVAIGGTNNLVGGTTAGTRNLLSGNGRSGVLDNGGGTGSNNVIRNNLIGTDANGTSAVANGQGIIIFGTSGDTVGGNVAGQGNVISGNGLDGVSIDKAVNPANNNSVLGNLVGTRADGTLALANGRHGIFLSNVSDNTVGGTTAAARNVISGNTQSGVFVEDTGGGGATGNVISGNFIGTNLNGTAAVANGTNGISFTGASSNAVGGIAAGASNTIAFNKQDGVSISGGSGNAVLSNSIHDNGTTVQDLGIDLNDDGVTPNDANDADTGPNNLQNFPALTSAISSGGNTTIQGNLNSTASTVFRLEFFSNPACDASGNGEGQAFLGSASVTTDAGGNAMINTTLPVAVAPGQSVTATATDPSNNTSEFSACVAATTSCVAPPSNLIAWYPGDGSASDIQGGDNGTPEGGLTFIAGKVAQAFNLNGTDADVKVPASSALNVGAANGMTVDAWINPADTSTERPIVEWNDGTTFGPHLWVSVTSSGGALGNLYANLVDTGGGNHVIQSAGGLINANSFQHVAVTYDKTSGTATLYLNGSQVAQQNLGVFTPKTASNLFLGVRPAGAGAGERYQGLLDEVEIFDRALSTTEVQAIFNAGGSGKCKPSADLAVTKTDSPDPAVSGNQLTYTITATNNGPDPATGVAVNDPLPAGVSFVSATPSQGTCSGTATVNCRLGTLVSGANATVTIVVTPNVAGTLTNTATVSSVQPDPHTANNSATANTTVNSPPPTFSIGGRVTDVNSNAVPGVSVSLGGAQSATTTTDADGNYSFAGLAQGSDFNVTPALDGFTFTPPSRTFNNLNANATGDFTANAVTHSISGRVTDQNGQPLLGVNVHLGGSSTGDTTTNAAGNYTFTNLAHGGSYNLTPTEINFRFSPASSVVGNLQADQTGVNFTGQFLNHTITGRIVDQQGNPLHGVTVTLAGSFSAVAHTDAQGNFTFNDMPENGTFVITPDKEGFNFNPAHQQVAGVTTDAQFKSVGTVLPSPTPTPDQSDDFSGGPDPDPDKWVRGILTNPPSAFDPLVRAFLAGGLLHIQPRADANGPSYDGLISTRALDLNSTPIVSVEVVQAAQGVGTQTIFGLGTDSDHWLRFAVQDGTPTTTPTPANSSTPSPPAPAKTVTANDTTGQTLLFELNIGGQKFSTGLAYDPAQHRFWRFRHDAPARVIIFETSPDAATWTERFRATLPPDQTSLIAELSAGTFRPSPRPVEALFDNFLISPSPRLQFGNADSSALESAGTAQVQVIRTGSAESPVSVDFATGDGTARAGRDYTPVSGTLLFGIGERLKTISIPVTDNSALDGDRTLNVTLSNPVGGRLGSISQAVLTILDDDQSSNPVDQTTFFVTQHYLDFIGRQPDDAGLKFWTNNIESCGANAQCREVKRIDTSAAFFLSVEFQQTGYVVDRFYEASFGRAPKFDEYLPDLSVVREGVVGGEPGADERLAQNKQLFAAQWVARTAFRQAFDHLNEEQYVDALAANAGVKLSEEERTALIVGLLTRRETRASVLLQIVENADFVQHAFNAAFVRMQYFGYLRRDPDTAGFNFWLAKLNQFGGDFRRAEMVKAFLSSTEYRARFGQP
ncbi:MAG TPA: FG-GAP-like repeat-containing protein, partial [Pyrinomonadaceae bacterium]|nr:FG-GAP-like repeat-containing protein [Pyrinomonadaceae bacterium]